MTSKIYDALLIGGGPAGLSIAVGLSRQLYSALILDSGSYRNAPAKHMHNVPGFDHVDPAVYRAKIKSDLQNRYNTIEFQHATIKEVRKTAAGLFEAIDESGAVYRGKKLGLGTGVRDMLEEQPEGYSECWGHGIVHCLFCHGYEERGEPSVGVFAAGILGSAERLHHVTLMAKRLSESVTVYTNGDASLATALTAQFHSSKIHVDSRKITRFSMVGEKTHVKITFADNTTKVEGFVVSHPNIEQKALPFVKELGLELTEMGDIKTTPPTNETTVSGCFACGDAATPMKSVGSATFMGSFTAFGMISQLQAEMEKLDQL